MQVSISKAREVYRPVAVRGAMLYFLINSLNNLDRVYHYSMAAFVQILKKGRQRARLHLSSRPREALFSSRLVQFFQGLPKVH